MIVLHALVDCERCGKSYEGAWDDISDTVQDLDEAPIQEQECPACGHRQYEEWPGWTSRTEAG